MHELGSNSARFRWRHMSWLAVAVLAPSLLRGDPAGPPPAPSVRVSPEVLRMGAFYNGATVRVEGEAPPGTAVLVVIRGPEETEFFNRKERVGPVWLSVGKVHVTRVPSLFIRLGGGDLHSLLDEASVEAHQLDDSAIERSMSVRRGCRCRAGEATRAGSALPCTTGVELDARQAKLVRSGYFDLKRQEGTYQVHPDAVVIADSAGVAHYSTQLEWPRKAQPGAYQVQAFACRNRSVVGRTSAAFQVVEVGLPARLSEFARSHALAYGLAAVLAAAITGFAMDSLTRRRWVLRAARGRRVARPTPPTLESTQQTREVANAEESELVGPRGRG